MEGVRRGRLNDLDQNEGHEPGVGVKRKRKLSLSRKELIRVVHLLMVQKMEPHRSTWIKIIIKQQPKALKII